MQVLRYRGGVTLAMTAAVVLACGRNGSNRVSGVDNVPPLISSILVSSMDGEAMVAWGGRARITVEAVDPDGDGSRMTYAWRTASGSAIGPNAKEAFYQHNRAVRDSDTVTVTVTDAVGGVATKEAVVRIANAVETQGPSTVPSGVPGSDDPPEECYETQGIPCLLVNGSRSPITVDPGERVTVTVPQGPGNAKDWVGLYVWTARHENRLEKQYLNGSPTTSPATGLATATLTFTLPMTAEDYNFRFFANDAFTLLSASARVTVRRTAPNPTNPPAPTPTPKPDDPTPPPTPEPTATPQPTATPTPRPNNPPQGNGNGFAGALIKNTDNSWSYSVWDPDGDPLTINAGAGGACSLTGHDEGASRVDFRTNGDVGSNCVVGVNVCDNKGGCVDIYEYGPVVNP